MLNDDYRDWRRQQAKSLSICIKIIALICVSMLLVTHGALLGGAFNMDGIFRMNSMQIAATIEFTKQEGGVFGST